MKIKQAPVFRFYFSTEAEATSSLESLEGLGIFGDTVASTDKDEVGGWKVVFAEANQGRVREALRRSPNRPKAAEVFDPQGAAFGWGEFKTLSIT